jgi:hypothetical protein
MMINSVSGVSLVYIRQLLTDISCGRRMGSCPPSCALATSVLILLGLCHACLTITMAAPGFKCADSSVKCGVRVAYAIGCSMLYVCHASFSYDFAMHPLLLLAV